jgi:hypothetical protein
MKSYKDWDQFLNKNEADYWRWRTEMKTFNKFVEQAELKTKIEKLDDGRYLVMKWSERGKFYPDGKPFKTGKEAKTREQELKISSLVYERISNAWKKAHSNVPIKKLPSNEYPAKILSAMMASLKQEFKKEFPKGPFTEAQVRRSLFSDALKNAMDSWDYLSGVIVKKWKK